MIGPTISVALGFATSVIAACSLLALWSSARRVASHANPKKLRVFKREGASTEILLTSANLSWMRPVSFSLRDVVGLESEVTQAGSTSFEILLRPAYSGRFGVSRAELGSRDALGLAVDSRYVPLELTVECLPLALLLATEHVRISPLTVGENPVGRKGSGQELYAVEEYQLNSEAKDIMWRRVARAEDESIPVRAREANLRTSVVVAILLEWGSELERVKRVDLTLEAVAQIGMVLLSLGTAIEVVYPAGATNLRMKAANSGELADLLIEMSAVSTPRDDLTSSLPRFDLLVGSPSCASRAVRLGGATAPILVVSEAEKSELPPHSYLFTGAEDLTDLTVRVLGR